MFIMTTRVDKRKLLIAAAAVIAAIVLLLALGRGEPSEPTASMTTAPAADTNDARVKFLTDLGWDVTASPAEAAEVRIPKGSDEVFARYNELQKSQGYDLSRYEGKRSCAMSTGSTTTPTQKSPSMQHFWSTRTGSSAATSPTPPPAARSRASLEIPDYLIIHYNS